MAHHTYYQRSIFPRRFWLGVWSIVFLSCGLLGFTLTLGMALLFSTSPKDIIYKVTGTDNQPIYATSPIGPQAAASSLSGVFATPVQYWSQEIQAWASQYQIDPNLIATLIQIESCGDPTVSSPAGAQGLFQVMPFHFVEGEDMLDTQTNATRGLNYLAGSLEKADGHAGLALAGYNGGHGVIPKGWAAWPHETQRYYYWGARIYAEAITGMNESPTLQEWLQSGGERLCARAQGNLELLDAAKEQAKSSRS